LSRRILITSGPTREYLDPVRYLSNASSGRMGAALAQAAIDASFAVTVVSGPVGIDYPKSANVVDVNSTREMGQTALESLRPLPPATFEPRFFRNQKSNGRARNN